MDAIDWSLFPSLPPAGTKASQNLFSDLQQLRNAIAPTSLPNNKAATHNTKHGTKPQSRAEYLRPQPQLQPLQQPSRHGELLAPVQAGPIRRASSFEDRRGRGNRAGVGAGPGVRQVRNSISGLSGAMRAVGAIAAGALPSGSGQVVGPSIARPPLVRRTASFELKPGTARAKPDPSQHGKVQSKEVRRARGHERTASDSTVAGVAHSLPTVSSISHLPVRTSSFGETSSKSMQNSILIPLGGPRQKTTKLLTTLQALTPVSRMRDFHPARSDSARLHPAGLIAPLAVVLEALVSERTVLQGCDGEIAITKQHLPAMRDGRALQLGGEGEFDWRNVRRYVRAVGGIIDEILPLLSAISTQVTQEHVAKVSELMKQIKVYVGKIKKVFGELAAMYVDQYGFMRGWWDEAGMKGAAAEVGRWGELLDA